MTPDEIRAKIQATIAGQGSAVDIGGQLPAILDSIVDLIQPPTPREILSSLTVISSKAFMEGEYLNMTKGAMCELMGISSGDLDNLLDGDALRIKFTDWEFCVTTRHSVAGQITVMFYSDSNYFSIVYEDSTGDYAYVASPR